MGKEVVLSVEVGVAEFIERVNRESGEIKQYGSAVVRDRELCEKYNLEMPYPVTDRGIAEIKKLIGQEGQRAKLHVSVESGEGRRSDPRFVLLDVISVGNGKAAGA